MSTCNKPLGLQNGRLRNSKITASSEANNKHAAWLGRLGRTKRGGYAGAWCARHNNHNQWIKFDFSRPMKITKVATQGRQDYSQWVTRYLISSSLDGIHWAIYRFKSQDKVRWKRQTTRKKINSNKNKISKGTCANSPPPLGIYPTPCARRGRSTLATRPVSCCSYTSFLTAHEI